MTHYSEQPLHQQNRHPAVPWLSTTWSGFLTLSPNIHLRTTAGGIEVAQTLSNLSWKGGRQKLSGVSFQHLNPVFLLQEMGIKDKQIGKETNSKSVYLSHLHKVKLCLLLLNYSCNLVLEFLAGKCLLQFWARQLNNWLQSHEQGVDFSWRQQHLWCAAIPPWCQLPVCGNSVWWVSPISCIYSVLSTPVTVGEKRV